MRINIGIDNGVSGTIGIINENNSIFIEMPTISQLNYTKKKANISRIDWAKLIEILEPYKNTNCKIVMERPMVNPQRFQATTSALRAMEATLIVLEYLKLPYSYIDSKEWQKALLPQGIKGSDELKKASMDIGCRSFPQHELLIKKHKDADGILMAEYCRRFL
ncbi:MAG: hypothetical protein PHS54_00365 [Clostridia bacterium]|nr:hypothetical protein [Clostridia bacterium]